MITTIKTAALAAATVLTCASIPLAGVGGAEGMDPRVAALFTTPPTTILLPLAPGDLDRVLSRPNSGFFVNGAVSFQSVFRPT